MDNGAPPGTAGSLRETRGSLDSPPGPLDLPPGPLDLPPGPLDTPIPPPLLPSVEPPPVPDDDHENALCDDVFNSAPPRTSKSATSKSALFQQLQSHFENGHHHASTSIASSSSPTSIATMSAISATLPPPLAVTRGNIPPPEREREYEHEHEHAPMSSSPMAIPQRIPRSASSSSHVPTTHQPLHHAASLPRNMGGTVSQIAAMLLSPPGVSSAREGVSSTMALASARTSFGAGNSSSVMARDATVKSSSARLQQRPSLPASIMRGHLAQGLGQCQTQSAVVQNAVAHFDRPGPSATTPDDVDSINRTNSMPIYPRSPRISDMDDGQHSRGPTPPTAAMDRSRSASDAQLASAPGDVTPVVNPRTVVTVSDIRQEDAEVQAVTGAYLPPQPTGGDEVDAGSTTARKARPKSVYSITHVGGSAHHASFYFSSENVTLHLNVEDDFSVESVKDRLWKQPDLPKKAMPPSFYVLAYINAITGDQVELFDEQQTFRTISILKHWLQHGIPFKFQVVPRKQPLAKDLQLVNKKIGSLIGFGLYRFDYFRDIEVDVFRRTMVSVRREATKNRDPVSYILQPDLDRAPLSEILATKLGQGGRLTVRLHLPFELQSLKTMTCAAHDSPLKLIASLLNKNVPLFGQTSPDVYLLKACGSVDYLTGDHPMSSFAYVRRCLKKDEKINLKLVRLEDVSLPTNTLLEEFRPIEDPHTHMGSHAELTISGRHEEEVATISLWDLARNYRVQVVACENLNYGSIESAYVEVSIYSGGVELCPRKRTHQVGASRSPRWGAFLNFDLACYNLPRYARICVTVWGRWNAKKKMELDRENDVYPLGWVDMLLMDFKGILRTGQIKLPLWPNEAANPIGTCVTNPNADDACIILKIDSFAHPVIFPSEVYGNEYRALRQPFQSIPDEDMIAINRVLASDPLTRVTPSEAQQLWKYRHHLMSLPESLPKLVQSAQPNNHEQVVEMKKLLNAWDPIPAEAALELLDANYADPDVRAFGVRQLEGLSDDQVLDFLLQLVQALKYEPYHDSALARFLLKRALCGKTVGHYFFWLLKSEMEDATVSLRFALLLEAYLRGASFHMDDLVKQNDVMLKLCGVADSIKRVKTTAEKKETLQVELDQCRLPTPFSLSLDPKLETGSLILEKCKYMDSKKLPLWLVFNNHDATGSDIFIIFKSGDDLRQDMLTLQMIRIMDKMWQAENLDLCLLPYGCLSTGHGVGMIEVILNAETVSCIQVAHGGTRAAFKDQPLEEWLRKQNPDDRDYEKAVETFTLSCAGYCVATYVLGIGDRHNDNIMLTKSGNLFHIDFGHFLGNIKKKFGFKRERAPFVLTPDFVYVMGKRDGMDSPMFQRFIDYCVRAFLILRRKSSMFISLFAMMLSTGIPELKSPEDIHYLRTALCLGMTEEEAAQEFRNLIFESLRLGWSTQLNWAIHNFVHK